MDITQALISAFQHLKSGNLSLAGHLFESVLGQDSQNIDALNGRGFIALQENRLSDSAADFKQSLRVQPLQSFALKMLGVVQGVMGEFDESMQTFAAALELDADDPEVYFNRANFRFQSGLMQAALDDLNVAIRLRESYIEARFNRANLLLQLGKFDKAGDDLDFLVGKITNNPDLWVALGLAKHKTGKYADALRCNDLALELFPNHPDALLNNSSVCYEVGEYLVALSWAENAIASSPNRPEAHYAKAQSLMAMSRFDEAVESYTCAIDLNQNHVDFLMGRGLARLALLEPDVALLDFLEARDLSPDNPLVYNNIGLAYAEMHQYEPALNAYKHSLEINSTQPIVLNNLGLLYASSRNHEAAIDCYEQALSLDAAALGAAWNRSLSLLSLGRYSEGWVAYETRRHKTIDSRFHVDKLWLGHEMPSLGHILLHAEQGLGDTIQFSRFVNLLQSKFAEVTLRVPRSLVRLCGTLVSAPTIISDDECLPNYDFQCSLMTLPLALGITVSSIPSEVPYLFADPVKVSKWFHKLSKIQKLKVGLVWRGGVHKNKPSVWSSNSKRDIPIEILSVLEQVEASFISLQNDKGTTNELVKLKSSCWSGPDIVDFSDELRDFSDTAALIENLDLVIAVDTAVAHLAGALGKKVWLLNKFDSSWRWFVDRTDSPWYPSMRIFNQDQPGDWISVMRRVVFELKCLAVTR